MWQHARRNQVAVTDDGSQHFTRLLVAHPAISPSSARATAASRNIFDDHQQQQQRRRAKTLETRRVSNNGDSECDRWADSGCLKAPPLSITATLDQTD